MELSEFQGFPTHGAAKRHGPGQQWFMEGTGSLHEASADVFGRRILAHHLDMTMVGTGRSARIFTALLPVGAWAKSCAPALQP